MMDEKLTATISGLIAVERRRRIVQTRAAVRAVRDDFTSRGAIGHGRFPMEVESVCAAELENRWRSWLSISRRAFVDTATRWTTANAEALGELLRSQLRVDWDGLLATYRDAVQPHDPSKRSGQLDEAKGRTEAEIVHELELLVLGEDRTRVPVTEQLAAPRYEQVLASWRRALDNPRATTDEHVQAARDAVGAVEQLARIVTASPTAALGDCIAMLKRAGKTQPVLLRGIEQLWRWISSKPGIRHGSATVALSATECQYCLKLAEASLLLLLGVDYG